MKWEWGNSGEDIYIDPETRKNAFSYRTAIARVTEQLIEEKEFEKAENLLDLVMKNLPVKNYQLYTLVEPFMDSYYKINKPKKARQVYNDLAKVYKGHIKYYSTLNINEQLSVYDDILTDLERFKTLIITGIENKDDEIIKSEIPYFLKSIKPFKELMAEVGYGINLDKFIGGLYRIGSNEQARELYLSETAKLKQNLNLASKLNEQQLIDNVDKILLDIEDYRSFLRIIDKHEDSSFFASEKAKFDDTIDNIGLNKLLESDLLEQ